MDTQHPGFLLGVVQAHLCLGKVPDPQRKRGLAGRSLTLQRHLGRQGPLLPEGTGDPRELQPRAASQVALRSRLEALLGQRWGEGAGRPVNPLLHSRWKTAPVKERSEKTSR